MWPVRGSTFTHMKKADPEMELRHNLAKAMRGKWRLTWHEDREIGPGVPDLSYVILNPGRHQTGWIELKAIRDPGGSPFKLKIEPSQHNWMNDHMELVPVHFLVGVGANIYLIDGRYHPVLDDSLVEAHLQKWAINTFTKNTLDELGQTLSALTYIN